MADEQVQLYKEAQDLYSRLKPEEVPEYTFGMAYVANHNSLETMERLGRIERLLVALGLPAIGALVAIAIQVIFGQGI